MEFRSKMSGLLLLLALIALFLLGSPLSAQVVVTAAGGYVGDGGPATSAALAWPAFAARDQFGDLYINDWFNNRVRKVDHITGIITTVAGTGLTAYNGDGGPAMATNLNGPTGLVINPAGDLLIADQGNWRVRKVDHVTWIVTTIAGNGTPGNSGDGGQATAASLQPWALALDAAGNLFVAATGNHVVRKITPSGFISTVAGNGVAGYNGDNIPATAASLNMPRGMLLDAAGNLYIADTSNHRVRKVSASGIMTTVAGNGQPGFSEVDGEGNPLQATAAKVGNPRGLAFDGNGNLLISNAGGSRIRKVDLTTGIISTIAGSGGGFDGDGHAPLETRFSGITGIWVEGNNLFVMDNGNGRVRKVDFSQGIVSTVAGGFIGDGNPATSASVSQPQQVAVDAAGNLYLADTYNNRIRKVDSAGTISTVAGTGITGYSGDGGPGTAAMMGSPYGVAVDTAGNVFIADTWNGFRKVDTSGTIWPFSYYQEYAPGWGYYPYGGLSFDGAGTLYFADVDCLVGKVDPFGLITRVAGVGLSDAAPNACSFYGDGAPATSAQLSPYAVAVDATGNVYIADGDNNRVRKVDKVTGLISTVAGNGTCGFSGDNGPATDATLCWPSGVALDKAGNLLIADTNNVRIRKVDAAGIITTIAGHSNGNYNGEGVKPLEAGFFAPVSVVPDSLGNLYVADAARVLKIVQPRGLYLHGLSSKAKSGLSLDYNPPAVTTAKSSDSPALQFKKGNPWQAISTWPATAALTKGTLYELLNLHAWLGLEAKGEKDSNFDLRAEVYKNGSLVSAGETHCVKGLATSPRETIVALGSFPPAAFNGTSDQLSLRVLARMGTTEAGTSCGGAGVSAGVRLYFDAAAQPALVEVTLAR